MRVEEEPHGDFPGGVFGVNILGPRTTPRAIVENDSSDEASPTGNLGMLQGSLFPVRTPPQPSDNVSVPVDPTTSSNTDPYALYNPEQQTLWTGGSTDENALSYEPLDFISLSPSRIGDTMSTVYYDPTDPFCFFMAPDEAIMDATMSSWASSIDLIETYPSEHDSYTYDFTNA